MRWELWDTESNSLVATSATEEDGLARGREILAANSPDYLDVLVLGAMASEGESQDVALPPVLEGHALRARLAATMDPPDLRATA